MTDQYAQHMSRDATEAQRLEHQFDLLTENMGYIIRPSIAKRLPPNARIADLATGTGVFLKRLAPAYPEAVLDGYDISSALFPEKCTLPSNMNLSVLDVKQPVPEELHGTYDLVHVRLIIAGMLPDDWKFVVRNLSQLLKPGGAMQWEECDYISAQQYRGRVDSTFMAVRSIETMIIDALRDRFSHGWNSLVDDMTAAGLVQVERDVVSSDRVPETREGITINSIVGCFHWARSGKDPVALSSAELDELELRAYEDIRSGGYVRYDLHVACGFKPDHAGTK